MEGNIQGTLSEAQAERLATAIGWSMIETWSATTDQPFCADGGTTTLRRPGASTSCDCGCNPMSSTAEKRDAIAAVWPWIDMLAGEGEPLPATVSAIAAEFIDGAMGPLPWPLDRPMADVDLLIRDLDAISTPDVIGARFDDPDEIRALRDLRAEARATNSSIGFVQVTDGGVDYQLYIRDDLPDEIAASVAVLLDQRMP
jgi:hypothetical protein